MTDIDRCLAEQTACREYIERGGPDVEGAKRGAEDWLWEEIIIRLRNRKMEIRRKSEIPA